MAFPERLWCVLKAARLQMKLSSSPQNFQFLPFTTISEVNKEIRFPSGKESDFDSTKVKYEIAKVK
jgi:hypothetical protein